MINIDVNVGLNKSIILLGMRNEKEERVKNGLMPINVTVTNSGKIELPEFVKNVSI